MRDIHRSIMDRFKIVADNWDILSCVEKHFWIEQMQMTRDNVPEIQNEIKQIERKISQ